jgi:hypothetical protein
LVIELTFDLLFVVSESTTEFLVLWVLLDGTDGSDGTSVGTDEVLESN